MKNYEVFTLNQINLQLQDNRSEIMRTENTSGTSNNILRISTATIIFCMAVLSIWWITEHTEKQMSRGLIQNINALKESINTDHIKALTHTDIDTTSIDYTLLKGQLATINSANPKHRSTCIIGRKANQSHAERDDKETPFFVIDCQQRDREKNQLRPGWTARQ